MKLWELDSVLGRNGVRVEELPQDPKWAEIRRWWGQVDQLVRAGNREILDRELDEEFVLAALAVSKDSYSLDGNILRRGGPLSAVEVARRFGGSILEEVQEFGSQDVTTWPRR